MRVRVFWDPAALFVFYRLPRPLAEAVDRAVVTLVERGEGRLEWVAPYHRLQAGKHDVVLVINAHALSITVLHIWRSRS